MRNGIILVDHGSRSEDSNRLLLDVAARFGRLFKARYGIVEPAHMELAEPTIGTAYAKCVWRGADDIIVCPFFLGPGKHWQTDIPELVAEAAMAFPLTRYAITHPLGVDDLILKLLDKRIHEAVSNQLGRHGVFHHGG
jgi:sirohydrochlorin ferrochelatase